MLKLDQATYAARRWKLRLLAGQSMKGGATVCRYVKRLIPGGAAAQPVAGRQGAGSFTLVETMIAASIFLLVVAGSLTVYIMGYRFWMATTLDMETSQLANHAVDVMVNGIGTNLGIRAASAIFFIQYPTTTNNSAGVHDHLVPSTYQYWDNGALTSPLASDPRLNMDCTYPTYNDGGSWRLMYSNQFNGAQYFEYNFRYQALSFGTTTAQRVLLAAYVTNATITTDARGIDIRVTVARRVGMFQSTNTASAYLKLRNKFE